MSEKGNVGGYRLVRLLGRGGMGEVYEAVAPGRDRVALKLFTAQGEHVDFLRKRFRAEGRLLARLQHPRLVAVRELSVDETSGRPFFTMDLVCGPEGWPETLEDLRRRHALDERRVAGFYADLREGLHYLHGRGVAHRDVKLENVLVDSDGRAVLSDFGISRIVSPELRHELSVTTTVAGERAPVLGSYGYLAPELKRGEPATPASDAYALGVAVFRLLTGVWYEADSTALDLLAGFDTAWAGLLARLLAADPSDRLPLPTLVLSDPRPVSPRGARFRKVFLALAACLLAAGAVGVLIHRARAARPHYTFETFFPAEDP